MIHASVEINPDNYDTVREATGVLSQAVCATLGYHGSDISVAIAPAIPCDCPRATCYQPNDCPMR
jgi:hypothetical protein